MLLESPSALRQKRVMITTLLRTINRQGISTWWSSKQFIIFVSYTLRYNNDNQKISELRGGGVQTSISGSVYGDK